MAESSSECRCYGCEIQRRRAGIPTPDRSADPCDPPGACARDGRRWTHSEWVDELRVFGQGQGAGDGLEAACDPPGACASRLSCGVHGEVRP